MLRHEPMTIQSRGRLYTTVDQRRRLGIAGDNGCGAHLSVGVLLVERNQQWAGSYAESATFPVRLGVDGQFRIPAPIRQRMGLERGETLRVTMRVTNW